MHAFNQRDVAGIFAMIRTLGALVGAAGQGRRAGALARGAARAARAQRAARLPRRPRVYFEEWDEPMISGIGWVSELIEAAGGDRRVPDLAARKSAKDRIVTRRAGDRGAPDIIIGSWCGKKFVPAKVAARPGFDAIPAVRDGCLREIKSPLILQPGPAALTDGLDALASIVAEWAAHAVDACRLKLGADPRQQPRASARLDPAFHIGAAPARLGELQADRDDAAVGHGVRHELDRPERNRVVRRAAGA